MSPIIVFTRISADTDQAPAAPNRRSHVFPVVASASARPSAKLPIKQWIFYSHANKSHFYKKGVTLNLVMKVRVLETQKWALNQLSYVSYIYRVYWCWRVILCTVLEESCSSASQKCSEQNKVKIWIRFLSKGITTFLKNQWHRNSYMYAKDCQWLKFRQPVRYSSSSS